MVRTSDVGPVGLTNAAREVVVVGWATARASEVVVFGLADATREVVVVGRGTLAEVLGLALGLRLVLGLALGLRLVLGLSVGAAPVSLTCSGMTASSREIEPPV